MRSLIIFLAIIFLISCKQNTTIQNQAQNKKVIYHATLTEGKKLELSLSNKESVELIRQGIANRKPLLRKIMPVFNMHLSIKIGPEEQNWLFSEPNYIKSKSVEDNRVYTIDSNLVKLFN